MIGWLTRDWGLKLISLILAIGLWYYAAGEEDIEVTRPVPLEIRVKNVKMSVLKVSAETLQVTFLTPRALLSDLTSKEITAVHEIGEEAKSAGDYSFRIGSGEIALPSGQIRVKNIVPAAVQVTLDELIVQKLAIKPALGGEAAIGYRAAAEEIQLDPNAILLEGPKGQLEKLDSIPTERIDLVGRIRSFRKTVALDLPPNVKALSEALVDVFVPVKEEFSEKIFEGIPVKILNSGGSSARAELSPAKVSFTLMGSKRQLDKIQAGALLAYIDLTDASEGEQTLPVKVQLPEDISVKDAETLVVKAVVKK